MQNSCYQIAGGFGLSNLQLTTRAEREPGPGEVAIAMRAWSLNYRDLMVVKGTYNPKMKLPMVPLSDGVGTVVAMGAGVTRVKLGDRVATAFMQTWLSGELTEARGRSALGGSLDGVAATRVVLHEEGVVPIPSHLSDAEAATLPCAAVTAWNALIVQGRLEAGQTVLTEGTGGVSLFALQFARLAGARVIATTSSAAKAQRLAELGAAHVVNYRSEPNWGDKVRALAGDGGVHHVVEVGGAGNMAQALRAVRMGGQIALIGVLAGGDCNPTPILMKHVRVQGIYVGSREMFEAMNRAISLHHLRPLVDRVFAFAELGEALRYLESGVHFGKVVVALP